MNRATVQEDAIHDILRHFSQSGLFWHTVLVYTLEGLGLLGAIVALSFGILGLVIAIRHQQPRGLVTAGVFMSAAAVILMLILLAATSAMLTDLWRFMSHAQKATGA